MTSILSNISDQDLRSRRQELKKQRTLRFLQTMWRSCLITGMAGGLFWIITLPNWVIRQPQQIEIKGNQFLSKEAISKLIKLKYPTLLMQIEPYQIVQQLEANGPISDAVITRKILPPSLTITVTERRPVAIATSPNPQKFKDKEGYLDTEGKWMPKSSYSDTQKGFKPPTLRVRGFSEAQLKYWSFIYQTIQNSEIKIQEINWQDPTNLILKTDLGNIYCGSDIFILGKQLTALAQMRELPKQVNLKTVAYINLTNPQSPTLAFYKPQIPESKSQEQ